MSEKSIIPIDAEIASEIARKDADAAYDAWLRAEVEAGLREADDPSAEWVSQEEVERHSSQRRAAWQAEIERQRKSA